MPSLYELHLPKKGNGPFPLLFILPILGRLLFLPDFWIERRIAGFFRRRGFACLILRRGFFYFDPGRGIEQIDSYLAETLEAANQALGEALARPKIDANRAGSIGISFGGIINVLLNARETRIKASVIALAGGSIPEILVSSRDPLVASYTNSILKGLKLSPEALVSSLKTDLKEEPLRAAPAVDPARVFMVIARFDHVVRLPYALALRQALRNPKTIFLPLGHYLSLLALPWINRKALQFFKEKLA